MSSLKCLILSAFSAVFFLVFSYWITNLRFPVSGEKTVLSRLEQLRNIVHPKPRVVPDSVLFVNVSYDKEFVAMRDEFGFPAGRTQITSRHKLLELLQYLKKEGTYKYVLLDVFFGEGFSTEWDDSLFSTIVSMPRIVVPCHADEPLADERLKEKAGLSDYIITFNESDFVKYPYFSDKQKSIPIRMYEEITGHRIDRKGILYNDGPMLARRSVVLTYELRADAMYADNGEKMWYNLGMDLLSDSIAGVDGRGSNLLYESPELSKDKYIVIGAFEGDDTHLTFSGGLSGAVINFNAFISLMNRHHIVSVTLLCVLFVVFFILSYLTFSRRRMLDVINDMKGKTKNKTIQKGLHLLTFLNTWVGLSLFLTILCVLTYLILGEAYDILATSTLFYVMQRCVMAYDRKLSRERN